MLESWGKCVSIMILLYNRFKDNFRRPRALCCCRGHTPPLQRPTGPDEPRWDHYNQTLSDMAETVLFCSIRKDSQSSKFRSRLPSRLWWRVQERQQHKQRLSYDTPARLYKVITWLQSTHVFHSEIIHKNNLTTMLPSYTLMPLQCIKARVLIFFPFLHSNRNLGLTLDALTHWHTFAE